MQFQTTKENLLNHIQIVQNIVSARISLPILSNILLEAAFGKLRLTATDLDIGISCEYLVEVMENGAITVPAKRFADIIHELPESQIMVSAKKNNTVNIKSETCEFKIMGLPKEEFPKLPEFKDKETLKLEQQVLKEMLIKTSFAASHEETRYILNGALLKIENDTLTIVATDGRRLALIERKINQNTHTQHSIIIPSKTINELIRNLKEGEALLTIKENQVLIDLGNLQIVSRLIEGEFPNYHRVIPPEAQDKIKLNRERFLLAVKRAAVLSTQDYQAVKLEVFKHRLVISKSTPDVGESREEIPADYSGKEFMVGFNPTYLIDVLKNLQSEEIGLEVLDVEKPGVIRGEGYLYIILPMRI
jgi:DNA polymerase-3 subunit beta